MVYIIILVVVVIIFIIAHQAAKKQAINELRNQGGLMSVLPTLGEALELAGFKLYKDEISKVEYRANVDDNCFISMRVWMNVNMQTPYEMKFEKFYSDVLVAANASIYIGPSISFEKYLIIIEDEVRKINLPLKKGIPEPKTMIDSYSRWYSNSGLLKDYRHISDEPMNVQLDFINSELLPIANLRELDYLRTLDEAEFFVEFYNTDDVAVIHVDKALLSLPCYREGIVNGSLNYINTAASQVTLLPLEWN